MVSKIKVDEIESSQAGGGIALNSAMCLKGYTTAQINALTGMSAGDIVYDSDLGTIKLYNGASWNAMSGGTFGFTASWLVVAGGGGGSSAWDSDLRGGGGGGAGGYRSSYNAESSGGGASTENVLELDFDTAYAVQIGAGGPGGSGGYFQDGTKGTNSQFGSITSLGGGGAGDGSASLNDGGSGAGAAYNEGAGTGTAGQGYDGGGRNTAGSYTGGSGGGAGGAGVFGPHRNSAAVAGGPGVTSYISGTGVERGKGGGSRTGGAGTANRGNGGGGYEGTSGYSGGSGIIILRYPTANAGNYTANGLTVNSSQSGSDTILEITAGSGQISWST
jgi:hypothetical protein